MMGYNKYGAREEEVVEEVLEESKSMIPTDVDGRPVAAINNTPPRVPQLSFLGMDNARFGKKNWC